MPLRTMAPRALLITLAFLAIAAAVVPGEEVGRRVGLGLWLTTDVATSGNGVVFAFSAPNRASGRSSVWVQPLGEELVLAGPGAFGGSRLPDVASDGAGRFVAVWWTLGDGVFARRIGWGGEAKTH